MRIARASVHREGRGAIVEVVGERGEVGRGEASPLEGRSRESLDQSIEALAAPLRSLVTIDEAADPSLAVAAFLAEHAASLAAVPSARFALDAALFDLLARVRGASVAELLGGPSPYADFALNALVRMTRATRAGDLIAAARRFEREGFAAIKLKLPREEGAIVFEQARRAILGLREAMPELELRVDVNAAWSVAVAAPRLEALAGLGLRYVEQPVAPEDVACLARTRVPWAADESLEQPEVDAERLLSTGACAAFVLKPTCIGGLLRSRALGEAAIARGAGVVVTHAFEGPIAIAAARQLALSFSRRPLACGLPPEAAHG